MSFIVNKVILIMIIIIYSYYVEVEVSDMSAVDTVLRADSKRLKLLEEEKKLVAEGEKGDDSNSERLQAVYEELEAIGAASAESRARRILAVSGCVYVGLYDYPLLGVRVYC